MCLRHPLPPKFAGIDARFQPALEELGLEHHFPKILREHLGQPKKQTDGDDPSQHPFASDLLPWRHPWKLEVRKKVQAWASRDFTAWVKEDGSLGGDYVNDTCWGPPEREAPAEAAAWLAWDLPQPVAARLLSLRTQGSTLARHAPPAKRRGQVFEDLNCALCFTIPPTDECAETFLHSYAECPHLLHF